MNSSHKDIYLATFTARLLELEAERIKTIVSIQTSKQRQGSLGDMFIQEIRKLADINNCKNMYNELCTAGLQSFAEKCAKFLEILASKGKCSNLDECVEAVKHCVIEYLVEEFGVNIHSDYCYCDDVLKGLSEALGKSHIIYSYTVRLESRGLIGASSGPLYKVFEVGVEWHPVYNTVYLPASSIKGAVRSFLLQSCLAIASLTSNVKLSRECVELVLDLLGSSEELHEHEYNLMRDILRDEMPRVDPHVSRVIFTDAILVGVKSVKYGEYVEGSKVFEKHVITPHYRPIKGVVRTEYDVTPVPIQHLVLREGLVFRGCIAVEKEALDKLPELARHLGIRAKDARDALKVILSAVFERGIGARTTRGYSRFKLTFMDELRCGV